MAMSKEEIFELLKKDIENSSGDGFYVFQMHALEETNSISYFKSFLDSGLVEKQAIEKWVEKYLSLSTSSNTFDISIRMMLIEHGIYQNNWTPTLINSGYHLNYVTCKKSNHPQLLLAIKNGGDISGYEDEIVGLGNLEILRAMKKHGYTNFSIYACKDLPTLMFIEEEAGGIQSQIKHGSEEWLRLLVKDLEITRYLVKSKIDLKLDSTNALALNSIFKIDTKSLFRSYYKPRMIEIIRRLVEAGADINIQDDDGNTLLHRAKGYTNTDNFIEIVKTLLALNADPSITNHKGESVILNCSNNEELLSIIFDHGSVLDKELANSIIDKMMDEKLITIESKNIGWIDPYNLHFSDNTTVPPHIMKHVFPHMLLDGCKEFIIHSDNPQVRLTHKRLLVEYLFDMMDEADAKRHLDYYIGIFKDKSEKISRDQIAFLLKKAGKQQSYRKYLLDKGVDFSEVDMVLSIHFNHNLFSIKKRYTLFLLPQYDLDKCFIEEITADIFDAYVAKYPYQPLFEETQDGFFLAEGIGGLGYENHFVFLKVSTMRLRQERSILLYSSPNKSSRFPIEVYEEEIRRMPYEGVNEYCRDGYDFNMNNQSNQRHYTVLCKYPETFEVIDADDTMDRAEYYAIKDFSHRRAVDIDGVTQAQNEYKQVIANYQVDRDL